jgi:hypothetical protein
MNQPLKVTIPDAPQADEESVSFTLPSGRKAVMRAPNGTHLIQANKLVKGSVGGIELVVAIANRVTLIDGKLMPFESFVLLPLADIMKVQEVMSERFLQGMGPEKTPATE